MAIEEIAGSSGDEALEGSATFVFDFVHLKARFEDVATQIEIDHAAWIGFAAEQAISEETFLSKVGPGGMLSKRVKIELGEVRRALGCVLVSMAWTATSTPFLFPRLEADVEFSEVEPGNVRIELRGSYRAPLGTLGERIDRLILHRMAESTVRAFLIGISEELERRLGLV
ncbi:MAG: hypothetical protein M0Z88_12000 [Actinomycetota bacterium]|nr:hypothetical protein [Actinomycetota bacterium]